MKGWHFVRKDRKLGYNDNRIVKTGRVYKVPKDRELELCTYGLHASKRIIDALKYAPGPVVCRVELSGDILHDDDKSVAYQRKVLWMLDAEKILWDFARREALDVVHLWDAPEIVVRYLKTGDESIRAAAEAAAIDATIVAARAAAIDAASAAARVAARAAARAAASAAAIDAAREAAWDAASAAARAAAWAAAGDKQNKRLAQMIARARKGN